MDTFKWISFLKAFTFYSNSVLVGRRHITPLIVHLIYPNSVGTRLKYPSKYSVSKLDEHYLCRPETKPQSRCCSVSHDKDFRKQHKIRLLKRKKLRWDRKRFSGKITEKPGHCQINRLNIYAMNPQLQAVPGLNEMYFRMSCIWYFTAAF